MPSRTSPAPPYEREIRTLASYFLVTGFEDGTYRPGDGLTRAQFAAMLATALDLPAGETLTFSDVSGDAWYAGRSPPWTGWAS